MNIRLKLITGMGAALVASTLVLVALNIFQMRDLLDRYLLNSALPANLEAIANSVERDLQAPITASRLIAENSYLKEWSATLSQSRDLLLQPATLKGCDRAKMHSLPTSCRLKPVIITLITALTEQ